MELNTREERNSLTDKPPFVIKETKPINATLGHKKQENQPTSCLRQFLKMEMDDLTSWLLWKACIAEFLGCFLLCFHTIAVGLYMPDATPPSLLQVAIAVCFLITTYVASLGAVSGAHINPAVSLGFALLRHISITRFVLYSIFQCAGAVTGSIVLKRVIHPDMVGTFGVIAPGPLITDQQAVVMEVILEAYLMFVVMAMLDKGRVDVTFSKPLTFGITVAANIFVGATISGACMNPARAIGPAVVMGNYSKQWIYWAGPLIGAVIGTLLYEKVFSVNASFRGSVTSCCTPRNKELEAPLKKEAGNMIMEWDTGPDSAL